MKKFLKVVLSVIFFQSLFFLTIFFLNSEAFYPAWFAGFIIFLFLNILISIKAIPSKKQQLLFKNLLDEYKGIALLEDEVRIESQKLEFVCPKCSEKNNYWTFLDDFKCNSCNSELWSSSINSYDSVYDKLFKKREKVRSFYDKISQKTNKKLRSYKQYGL